MSVSAGCVITLCIPSEEWIAVPTYTDTATPIIGDPRCLLSCRHRRPDVPGLTQQGSGYSQSRSTAIFPTVDILQASYGCPSLHFSSQTEFLSWYSASCLYTCSIEGHAHAELIFFIFLLLHEIFYLIKSSLHHLHIKPQIILRCLSWLGSTLFTFTV